MATWLFVFPPSFLQSTNNDAPPSFSVTTGKFQGNIISGADVCKIPGLLDLSSKVAGYKAPPGLGTQSDLKAGAHLYHSDTDVTIQQIIDRIVPTDKNKIMIAYYPAGVINEKKQFLVHPKIEGQLFVVDAANATTSKIPANEGFLILSCQDTKIWNIKNETTPGQAEPANLATIKEGWILMSRSKAADLSETIKKYPDKIKSTWIQTDAGFNFKKPKDSAEMNLANGYNMVWLKIFTSPIAIDPPKNLQLFTPAKSDKLGLSWDKPDSIAVKDIKNYTYKLEYGTGETVGKSSVKIFNLTIDPNSDGGINYETPILIPNTNYWFTVALVDKDGNIGKKAEFKTKTASAAAKSNDVKVFLTSKTADQTVQGGDTVVLGTLTLFSDTKAGVKQITFTQKGNVNGNFFENVELFMSKKINENGQLDNPILLETTKTTTPKSITMAFDGDKLNIDNSYVYLQLKTKIPVEKTFVGATYNIGIEKLTDVQLYENNIPVATFEGQPAPPVYGNIYTIEKTASPATQTVVLVSVWGADYTDLYKAIMAVTDFNEADAKGLIDNVSLDGPVVIKKDISPQEAAEIQYKLGATGAIVELK